MDKIVLNVPRWKRIQFWTYLVNEKVPRPIGVTDRRLEKIKEAVLMDNFLWSDVVLRFGAGARGAREFYTEDTPSAKQSRSNFWAMVREKISPTGRE